jgi:hypothetical protein
MFVVIGAGGRLDHPIEATSMRFSHLPANSPPPRASIILRFGGARYGPQFVSAVSGRRARATRQRYVLASAGVWLW